MRIAAPEALGKDTVRGASRCIMKDSKSLSEQQATERKMLSKTKVKASATLQYSVIWTESFLN